MIISTLVVENANYGFYYKQDKYFHNKEKENLLNISTGITKKDEKSFNINCLKNPILIIFTFYCVYLYLRLLPLIASNIMCQN